MKALMIAPQPFFSPRGTPLSVYYRTLVMAENGISIDLLTYGEGQDIDLPGVRTYRIPRFARLGSVKIGPSRLKLFLDVFLIVYTVMLLLKNRYSFVHAHEEAVFFCSFLKPLFGFKLIYDMHSSLPQQLSNFQFTRSRALINIFKKLEDHALKSANGVITICPDLAQYVDEVITDKSKHVLIENSIFEPVKLKNRRQNASGTLPSDLNIEELISNLPDSGELIVYAGTLEAYQGIEILIEAFQKVRQMKQEAVLLIVGGTREQVNKYKKLVNSLGLGEYVFMTGRVPQAVAQQLCKKATIQVSPRSAGTNTPLKIYEQLSSGIPLVATDIYSHTQAIDSKVAFMVPPDAQGMSEGIIKALDSKAEREQKTAAAFELYRKKYSRPMYEKKLKRVICRALMEEGAVPEEIENTFDDVKDRICC